MKERNDAQQLAKACMEEKTQYRLQIRQHQEQYDKLAKQFLEAKQEILSLKSRYRKSSDVTVSLSLCLLTSACCSACTLPAAACHVYLLINPFEVDPRKESKNNSCLF